MDDIPGSSGGTQRFLVGDLVEVLQTEEGLRGSWHPAVVVEVQKGRRKVEYDELLSEDGLTKLQEFVPVGKVSDGDKLMGTLPLKLKNLTRKNKPVVRPRPPLNPCIAAFAWQEGTWVDCKYEDAWWEGILNESVTSLVCEDVASLTSKSSVEVYFPEEDDLSQMLVKNMRIGQVWDEETGHWNLKGCVPVPVVRPNKRARTNPHANNSAQISQQEDENARTFSLPSEVKKGASNGDLHNDIVGSDLLDNCTIDSIIKSIQKQQVAESVRARRTSDRGVKLLPLGCKGSATLTDVEGDEKNSTPTFAASKREGGSLEQNPQENDGEDESHVRPAVDGSDPPKPLDVEAARNLLTDSGWKISKVHRKKAAKTQWYYRSPKYDGSVKTFSSLSTALNFEAEKGLGYADRHTVEEKERNPQEIPSEGSLKVAGSTSTRKDIVGLVTEKNSDKASTQKCGDEIASVGNGNSAEKGDVVKTAPTPGPAGGSATGDLDDADARQFLIESGWTVSRGRNSQSEWLFKSPKKGKKISSFTSLSAALAECKRSFGPKVARHLGANQGQKAEIHELQQNDPQITRGSGPSFLAKPRGVPDRTPILSLADERDYSNLDGDDRRDVDVIDSNRKRTEVNLGQKLTHSGSSTPDTNSHQVRPFGRITKFIQTKDAYIMQADLCGFSKEHVKVIVERGDIVLKARYAEDNTLDGLSVRCHGALNSRVVLPKDIEHELISAELKSSFLTVTLPRSRKAPTEVIEIQIK